MRLRSDIKQIRIKHVINRVGSNKLTSLEKCYIMDIHDRRHSPRSSCLHLPSVPTNLFNGPVC